MENFQMRNVFMIIKPEGITYFKRIIEFISANLHFSKYSLFWIDDWKSISMELYAHYFIDPRKRDNFESLVYTENTLYGNKAICIIFESYCDEQVNQIVALKRTIRNLIIGTEKDSIVHILDLNKAGITDCKNEVIVIQYEDNKPAKEITSKGFFRLQHFSFVHAPDPEEEVIKRENAILSKYVCENKVISKDEERVLFEISRE